MPPTTRPRSDGPRDRAQIPRGVAVRALRTQLSLVPASSTRPRRTSGTLRFSIVLVRTQKSFGREDLLVTRSAQPSDVAAQLLVDDQRRISSRIKAAAANNKRAPNREGAPVSSLDPSAPCRYGPLIKAVVVPFRGDRSKRSIRAADGLLLHPSRHALGNTELRGLNEPSSF